MFKYLFQIAATVATSIGTSNPLAGLAIQKISSTLLGKADGTVEEIENAVPGATPEQLGEIKQIEARFKGIKETTEVIEAITLIAAFLTKKLKDGLGLDDAMSLFEKLQTDFRFQAALAKASLGIREVPAELADLDFEESITLGMLGMNFVKEIVKTMKEE
jgi:hypothetical protein